MDPAPRTGTKRNPQLMWLWPVSISGILFFLFGIAAMLVITVQYWCQWAYIPLQSKAYYGCIAGDVLSVIIVRSNAN